jgi:hypothetical protein
MDIDHFFAREEIGLLSELAGKIEEREVYLFLRRNVGSEKPLHSAPNLYMARKQTLLGAGGYDERFCGHYGYEDVELRKRLRKSGTRFVTLEAPVCYRKGSLMTQGLDRSTEHNKALLEDIQAGRIELWRGRA